MFDRINPDTDAARHRADEIFQRVVSNRMEIIGAEKRLTRRGKVQYREPGKTTWTTIGRIYPHELR